MNDETLKIGIITISDRASKGIYDDISGKAIEKYFKSEIKSEWERHYTLIPDSFEIIKKSIVSLSDKAGCHLIVTTGGTGPTSRDITPEATEAACTKLLPGFGELMRLESLKHVSTAILSRQTAGIRGKSLVINLPGKPRSIEQCLSAVLGAIPECIKLIGGPEVMLVKGNGFLNH